MKKIISLLLLIIVVLSLAGCNRNTALLNLQGEEIFTQEGNYFVYLYKNDCLECEQTKPYIEIYLEVLENDAKYENKSNLYGVNLDDPVNSLILREYQDVPFDDDQPINFMVNNVENWDDLYIGSVPALISIRTDSSGKTFSRFEAIGSEDIFNRLNEYLG